MRRLGLARGRRLDCPHESEVLSAVYTNRWPHQVSESLHEHAAECRICGDVIAVASAFEDEADLARAHASVPDSGIVWWRAQLRARQEAAKEAVRPITVAQAIGLAACVGVLGAIFGATATWFQQTLRWMMDGSLSALTAVRLPALPGVPEGLGTLLSGYATLLGGLGLVFVLASVAAYFAVRATERDA